MQNYVRRVPERYLPVEIAIPEKCLRRGPPAGELDSICLMPGNRSIFDSGTLSLILSNQEVSAWSPALENEAMAAAVLFLIHV